MLHTAQERSTSRLVAASAAGVNVASIGPFRQGHQPWKRTRARRDPPHVHGVCTCHTGHWIATTVFRDSNPERDVRYLVELALRASGAAGAAFAAPTDDPTQLSVPVAVGLLAPWQGQVLLATDSLAGSALAASAPILVADPTTDPRTAAAVVAGLGPLIAAPVVGERGAHGVLSLAGDRTGRSFGAADADMVANFTTHAALVLVVAELRRDNERLHLLEDRQLIANDIQQTVIRRLFGLGLSLQSTAARATNPEQQNAIRARVGELDRIIRDVRTAVFSIQSDVPD